MLNLIKQIKRQLIDECRQETDQRIQTSMEQCKKRFEDIEKREEWTRNRFEETTKRIEDIEVREEWTRGRFEEIIKRIEDIESREIWARNNIDQLQSKTKLLAMQNGTEQVFYQKKTYSQSGEDAIVGYILNYLNIPFDKMTYLDLGANHAKELSNSYFFYEQGAMGVLVEANPELINELKRERSRDIIVNKAIALDNNQKSVDFYSLSGDGLSTISYESAMETCRTNPEIFIKEKYTIPAITIENILEMYFSERNPTMLSIDLEGIEMQILEQINFEKYRPLIIIIEDIPYSPQLIVNGKENKALKFLTDKGYVEYAFTGINAIYLDQNYVKNFYEND